MACNCDSAAPVPLNDSGKSLWENILLLCNKIFKKKLNKTFNHTQYLYCTITGVIIDKIYLPITRLNFGKTQLVSSSGVHTLGRLECTGQVAVVGIPKSCADLWRIGHSLRGLYSVMGTEHKVVSQNF